MTTQHVYKAIAAISQQMGVEGIEKSRRNQQQGFMFRGIDDVLNALNPMLAKNNLCILPFVLERHCDERQSAKGSALFYVTVKARFDFVSAEDGSKHEVVMYGEAMDSGDKATNKAMSAAYKYAAIQAFCIPTEGDNDADHTTHEVQPIAQSELSENDMDNVGLAMNEADDFDALKKVFGDAYKKASDVQKLALQKTYNQIKLGRKWGA